MVGSAEIEVALVSDRDHVEVGVGDLHPGDDHPDPCGREGCLLRLADRLGDHHEVSSEIGFQIEPVIDLVSGHHEGVTGAYRSDRHEGDAAVVSPHEASRDLTIDDAGEKRSHGANNRTEGRGR